MSEEEATIDELAEEFYFMQELLQRSAERLRRGKTLPEYMYKAVINLSRAYIGTVKRLYPDMLTEEIASLRADRNALRQLYKKHDCRAEEAGNSPCRADERSEVSPS